MLSISRQGKEKRSRYRSHVRLCDKIVRPKIHAHQFIHIGGAAGNDNNRDFGLLANLPADVKTVKEWQIDVQKDQVRGCLQCYLYNALLFLTVIALIAI